jgi:hypothetical protein
MFESVLFALGVTGKPSSFASPAHRAKPWIAWDLSQAVASIQAN